MKNKQQQQQKQRKFRGERQALSEFESKSRSQLRRSSFK